MVSVKFCRCVDFRNAYDSVQKSDAGFLLHAILVMCVTHHGGAVLNVRCANMRLNVTAGRTMKSKNSIYALGFVRYSGYDVRKPRCTLALLLVSTEYQI